MSTAANGFRNTTAAQDIDEDLHSRQLAVYGRDSMRRLAASQILILGATGLGVEVGALDETPVLSSACVLRLADSR